MADTELTLRTGRPTGGLEKAAILLLTLGSEVASAIFKQLSEVEVRQLSAAIARLRSIPKAQAAAVQEEAWRRLTNREGLLVDGQWADHADAVSMGRLLTARSVLPSADITRSRSIVPSRSTRVYAIALPSGDHRGVMSRSGLVVRRRRSGEPTGVT